MAKKLVEFFFDINSPYSYIAAMRLHTLEQAGAEVQWRPILLGALFKATGNQPPINVSARAPYLMKDIHRLANHWAIPLRMPSVFPVNSLAAMRCLCAVDEALRADVAHAMFEAYWVDKKDISNVDVLTEIVGKDVLDKTQTPEIKEELRAATEEASLRGAFGVPTFFCEGEMYFGCDRMFLLEAQLREA